MPPRVPLILALKLQRKKPMPPKKKTATKKTAVKKAAVKKSVKKAAKKAVKKVAKKVAKKAAKKAVKATVSIPVKAQVSREEIERKAFEIYMNRQNRGIYGDQKSDWEAAENLLSV
jgi:predicted solute-binding protein